jgi:hypothetical protein
MTAQVKSQKPLLALAIFLMLITISMFATIFYQQYRATLRPPSIPYRLARNGQLATEQQQAFLDKAQSLREKWRKWASEHQEDIRQMLHSSDEAALLQVYSSLPETPTVENAGVAKSEFGEFPYRFTWNKFSSKREAKSGGLDNSTARRLFEAEDQVARQELEKDFANYHDICIGRSVNPGTVDYKLWVSGRITKLHYSTGGQKGHEEEIVSPYEFLR